MYCKKCGTQIEDNVRFCPSCGTDQTEKATQKKGSFHCPKCGSEELQVTPSVENNKFMLMPLKKTLNYWSCKNCGTRFMDVNDLNYLVGEYRYRFPRFIGGGILLLLIGVFAFIEFSSNIPIDQVVRRQEGIIVVALATAITLLTLSMGVYALILAIRVKKKIPEYEKEREYVEKNAYNNQQ